MGITNPLRIGQPTASRLRESRHRRASWLVVLVGATVFQTGGTVGWSQPRQGPPAKESATELEARINQLRTQGKVSDAVEVTKRWVDANRQRVPVPELVGVTRALAELQVEADQPGDAAATLRGVVRTMRGNGKDFPDWTVRTVTAELSDVDQLAKLKGPDRKRLALARGRLRAAEADPQPEGDPSKVDLARAEKTRTLLDGELEAVHRILGEKTPSVLVADIREMLGLALLHNREWKRAETEFAAALDTRITLYGEVHPQTAQTRAMLALVISDPMRPDPRMGEAIAHDGEVVAVFERTLGPHAKQTLDHVEAAALRCSAAGRPDLAMVYAQRLATALRQGFPGEPRRWIPATELLGQSAQASGNLPVAEEAYRELGGIQRALGEERGEAEAKLVLGQIQAGAGNFAEAIKTLKDACGRFEKIPGARSDVVSCLVPLAFCHRKTGNIKDARESLDAADRIRGATAGRSIEGLTLHLERGRLLLADKDWKGARSALKAALAAAPDGTVTITAPLLAEAHRLLADAELGLGDPAEALKQLEAGRKLCVERMGKRHPATLDMQYELGLLQLQRGDKAAARASLAEAFGGLVEATDSLRLVAESEAVRRLARINTARDALLSAMRSEKCLPASALYEHVWRSKGLLTRHSMGRFGRAAEDPRLDKDLNRLREVKVELSNLLWGSPPATPEEARKTLTKLSGEKKLLESRLAFRPKAAGEPEAPPASPQDLAKLLPPGMAVVDFIVTSQFEPSKDRTRIAREKIFYEAYVLRSRDGGRRLEVNRVELGTQRALGPTLLRWREGVSRKQNYTAAVTPEGRLPPDADSVERLAAMPDDIAYRGLGARLRQAVWDKIEPHLAGIETVVILPDVDFDRLPWYALPGKKVDTDLIDDYAICTALNGEHLVAMVRRSAGGPPRKAPPIDNRAARSQGCLFVSDLQYGEGRGHPFVTSGQEVPDIMGLKAAPRPHTWLRDDEARPSRVIEEMGKRRVVHLSTHGKYATRLFASAFTPD